MSVIIPALNEEPRIASAIHSAFAAGAAEVIVCDGGSSDQTLAVAQQSGAIALQSPAGRAIQCNAAANGATGVMLLFLHADCRLHSNSINELSSRLMHSPEIVCGGFRQLIDDPRWRYRVLQAGNAFRIRRLRWVYGDQGLFVRTDVFRVLGGFPQVALMEDLILSRRLVAHGKTVLLDSPLVVSARRWHRRGVLRQTLRNWLMITLLFCGVSPNWLARFYPNVR